jgi:hypothetical protein
MKTFSKIAGHFFPPLLTVVTIMLAASFDRSAASSAARLGSRYAVAIAEGRRLGSHFLRKRRFLAHGYTFLIARG